MRVLKPGGYLAAFGATRTFHRFAAGIEDAGFRIRDTIGWLYTQGFPASLDVTEAVNAHKAGAVELGDPNRDDVLTITRFLRDAPTPPAGPTRPSTPCSEPPAWPTTRRPRPANPCPCKKRDQP